MLTFILIELVYYTNQLDIFKCKAGLLLYFAAYGVFYGFHPIHFSARYPPVPGLWCTSPLK